MARRDLARVTDREAGHVPLGLGVPQRLVGLAQPGKQQMQRLAVIVDNATAASPGGERILEVDYAGAKAADVVIGPQAIAGQVLAGSRRGVDQAADQPARRAAPAVAAANALISEERRVGKDWVIKVKYRWWP